ncbi:isoprimeverose transporter [Lachnospiraceae bacterium]|nr:isoprimeverose transporter [Lachnospiraceae bacterium]
MMGMTIGQIVLNLSVMNLIKLIGKGNEAAGYRGTAMILAIAALPMFWAVAIMSKESITVEKKDQGKISDGLKLVFKNRNLLCAMFYSFFNMFGILGRISVAVFFYMHCVGNYALISVFMMMQMAVGTIIMPFAPTVADKLGKRNTAILSMIIQGGALIIMYFGPTQNIPFNFFCMILYGLGYIAGPCGAGMMVDAINDFDDKHGIRNDGMAFSFQGTAIKIATAIANSVFLLVMGAYGYVGGGEITPHVQTGINLAANLLPGIVFLIGIIPLWLYQLDEPGYMDGVRERLQQRNMAREKEREH